MLALRATFPAELRDDDVLRFTHMLLETGLAVSMMREGNNRKSPWNFECLVEGGANLVPVVARVKDAAQLFPGLSIDKDFFQTESVSEDTDWLAISYRAFPSFSIGPFYIFGSHSKDLVPEGQTGLQIDAATAFGSGEHGTTKGCLLAMLDLKEAGVCPWNVLDMGTGSGILGIAAWKLWKTPVLAVDNDPEAVRVAERHARANHVSLRKADLVCTAGMGFQADSVQARKPFDLIIANILAGPLKDMAPDLIDASDTNGYVILSGILNEQADEVLEAYKDFRLAKRFDIGEWSTLVLQNAMA